jgi:putative ABC transport system permease protein
VIRIWMGGLVRRRAGRLVATVLGVAVAVALLASLGAFLAASKGSMTARAVREVAVDWQVQVQPGADPAAVLGPVRAASGVRLAVPVGYAQLAGLTTTSEGTTQTTGPGVVLGLPDNYRADFPSEIRTLTGTDGGMLLAQQTAANLHAKPGDLVQIARAGLAPVQIRVDGVVDLPQANSLFQKAGAPPSSQPAAPPDNVVLLPESQWHSLFDPLAAARPDLVSTQIHVARTRALPADPAAAYAQVSGAAHNLEAHTAGGAVVGDNLGAALDAARADAAYAQVLFLFLGLPGAVLAGLLTGAVTAAGALRRRQEQALLRTRGATSRQLIGLAGVEAGLVGVAGAVIGLGAAALVGRLAFGSVRFGTSAATAVAWVLGAALVGLLIAAASILLPAYRDLRTTTVTTARQAIGRSRGPWWARWGWTSS